MVLELHIPAGTSWHALGHELPVLLAYVLSFVYLGIYWNNHHHMMAAVSRVSGAVLWANLHLLFWLSLVPFSTAWMSEHRFPSIPTAFYGVVLLAAAIAYLILQTTLLRAEGAQSKFRVALGSDVKGKISALLYVLGIGLAFADRWIGLAVYVAVALIWLVPDRRVESHLTTAPAEPSNYARRVSSNSPRSASADRATSPSATQKPALEAGFSEAADGTRTHDLLHGNRLGNPHRRL